MTAWILKLVRFQVSRKRASQMWHGRLQRTRDGRLASARRAEQQHAPADGKQRIEIADVAHEGRSRLKLPSLEYGQRHNRLCWCRPGCRRAISCGAASRV